MTYFWISLIIGFATATSLGLADSLELRNGKPVNGTYVKADSDNIWIDVEGKLEAFSIKDVSKLTLRSDTPTVRPDTPTVSKPRAVATLDQIATASLPGLAGPKVVTLPAGTLIGVRLTGPVVLGGSSIGRTFQAMISESVLVINQPVIPKGADALVKLVVDRQSMFGSKTLKFDLVAVRLNGYMLFLDTSKAEKKTSMFIPRLATGGAIASIAVGAMAGARGGWIGAGIGTIVGFSSEALGPLLTKKKKMPAETLLYFILVSPVSL
jgi:hypothetical protein